MPPFSEYTIGWISALPLEMAAAMAVLDEDHGRPNQQPARDKNNYVLGRIGQHNVVIACLPAGVYGTTSAAVVAMDMIATFRHLRFSLMVGIGGGCPSTQCDLRLGDVVVGRPQGTAGGVIQYDMGKTTPGEHLQLSGSLNKPHPVLLTAVSGLHALHMKEGNRISEILAEMTARQPQMDATFSSPGQEHDHLYAADYAHPGGSSTCEHCDKEHLVQRPERKDSHPAVFYGTIASGNQVMKDGVARDRLARQLNVICFEMEAAGLMDHLRCLVIRGICDYADSHKNKAWQGYAAATAAAYAKELLYILPASDTHVSAEATDQRAHPSFLATKDWYARDEILLASLIPNIKYPNQDALVVTSVKGEEDVSICVDQALNEYFPVRSTPIDTGLVHLLWRVFGLSDSQPTASHWRVQATESRTYMLRQPRAIFKQICAISDVREWLEESFMESQPAYFLVGYRTALNAKLTWGDVVNTNPNDGRYISGERIYAICYRKISFRFLKGSESAFLAASNCWNLFSDGRGQGSDDDFLEVDIPDHDEPAGDEN